MSVIYLHDKVWENTFNLADSCKEMADQGMTYEIISKSVGKPTELIIALVRMAQYFPEEQRFLNVPIGIYLKASLFPDPVATLERAWDNNLQAEDLGQELEGWARRFDVMGYGDPPCLTPEYKRQRQTPLEEALGIDENGMTTARRLYEFLELNPAHYARWAKKNILENDFADINIDYFPFTINGERGNFGGFNPNQTQDYKITGRFAKKLAMASRSSKGEQVRDYFVAVEERAKALTNGEMPTGKIPSEILLGIAEKYGDKLFKSTLDKIIQAALG